IRRALASPNFAISSNRPAAIGGEVVSASMRTAKRRSRVSSTMLITLASVGPTVELGDANPKLDWLRRAPGGLARPRSRLTHRGFFRRIRDLNPRRCVVARLLPAPHVAIDARVVQTTRKRPTEEQVIDAQPRIPSPSVPEVIPEGVDALAGMLLAHGIGPALGDEPSERVPHLGPEESIIDPALGLIDVEVGRYDVVVAGENDRRARRQEVFGVLCQTLKPAQLVVELRARRRVAVRQIKAADQHAVDRRLDIAAICVVRITRKSSTCFDGIRAACEDGDAIPAFLAMPDRAVAGLEDGSVWKSLRRRLQFL